MMCCNSFSGYMDYFIGISCSIIKKDDRVVVINREEGTWINLHEKVFHNIKYYLQNDTDMDERFRKIFHQLLDLDIISVGEKRNVEFENITIMMTSKCNLICKHCCATEISKRKDITQDILDKAIYLQSKQITLSGGEALLHPDFNQMVKKTRDQYTGLLVLATNGTLIDSKIDIIKKSFDKVEISLDGVDNLSVERYRGDGVYDKVVQNTYRLSQEKQIKTALSMVSYTCKEQDSKIDTFKKLNQRYGTVPIIRELFLTDRVLEHINDIVDGGINRYIKVEKQGFLKKEPQLSRCGMLRYQLFLDSEGFLYPCGGLGEDRFCLGKIEDDDLVFDIQSNSAKYYEKIINIIFKEPILRKCQHCCVREFCWTCISKIISIAKIEELFRFYCRTSVSLQVTHFKLRTTTIFLSFISKMCIT